MPAALTGSTSTFGSLRNRNFRLFAAGQIISSTGAWTARIAQDWLVLTLTASATAVGITIALQFLPTLLLGLVGGAIADRFPKREVLRATQIGMASMATVLAALTLSHHVTTTAVDLVAFGLGVVTAVDNPTRQSFVHEMVGPDLLPNAISINSSVFQLGALIGPALAGLLVAAVGAGWAFAANALSFAAPLLALRAMREQELTPSAPGTDPGRLRDGLRQVAARPELLWPIVLIGVFGLFTVNLPVTLAAYARTVFHSGPGGYGLLSSIVASGSLAGALVSARRPRPRLTALLGAAAVLAALEIAASLVPGEAAFAVVLAALGGASLLLATSANATVQLAADDAVRGRVMGVYLLVFIGSGAIGGPLVGGLDERLGPRAGMLVAGVVPAAVTALIALRLARAPVRAGSGTPSRVR